MRKILIIIIHLILLQSISAKNHLYVKDGILYTPNHEEFAAWGVNFQPPLTWEYHNRQVHVGTIEQYDTLANNALRSFDELERMGVELIRCHLTPADFTDENGNLVETMYLKLLDLMIYEGEKRGIKIYITLLNHMLKGYVKSSFLMHTEHKDWIVDEALVKKSQNFIQQLLKRENPFNGKKYHANNNILFWEIINEPRYFSFEEYKASKYMPDLEAWASKRELELKEENYRIYRANQVEDYIKLMYKTIRKTGAKQPIVWNCNWSKYVSQYPQIFERIAQSPVEVISFCFYPGQTPHPFWSNTTDNSKIDFSGKIKQSFKYENLGWSQSEAFKEKAKIVYEYETFYNNQSHLYPAIAHMFRSLGVQSACMWTYSMHDYAPYITGSHNLNQVCTPAKAAGFAVAKQIFHSIPLYAPHNMQSATEYSTNNFLISRKNDLAIFKSDSILAYTSDIKPEYTEFINSINPKRIIARGNSKFITSTSNGIIQIEEINNELHLYVEPNVIPLKDFWRNNKEKDKAVKVEYNKAVHISIQLSGWCNNNCQLQLFNGEKLVNKDVDLLHLELLPGKYIIKKQNNFTIR